MRRRVRDAAAAVAAFGPMATVAEWAQLEHGCMAWSQMGGASGSRCSKGPTPGGPAARRARPPAAMVRRTLLRALALRDAHNVDTMDAAALLAEADRLGAQLDKLVAGATRYPPGGRDKPGGHDKDNPGKGKDK